jgi:hypothetical protein
MATAPDPPSVGRSNEHALRRFLAARRAGDEAGATAAWQAVVEQEHDRVRGMVDAWGRKEARLSRDERDEAYSLALHKFFFGMQGSFRGTSMGELVLAVKQCATYACLEVQRQAAQHSGKVAPLHVEDEDGEQRLHDGVARGSVREFLAEEADEAEADAMARDVAFLRWAMPKLRPGRREVMEAQQAGEPAEQTAERLGISMDNLYQRRTRATKDLRKLKEQWDG